MRLLKSRRERRLLRKRVPPDLRPGVDAYINDLVRLTKFYRSVEVYRAKNVGEDASGIVRDGVTWYWVLVAEEQAFRHAWEQGGSAFGFIGDEARLVLIRSYVEALGVGFDVFFDFWALWKSRLAGLSAALGAPLEAVRDDPDPHNRTDGDNVRDSLRDNEPEVFAELERIMADEEYRVRRQREREAASTPVDLPEPDEFERALIRNITEAF